MGSISTFERIAADIGVQRYKGEDDMGFCVRCAYSAARFWASAFCMDDGQEGKAGLSKQALSIRLRRWIEALDSIMPGLGKWFELDDQGMRMLYGRLIDIGDILPIGKEGKCFARTMRIEPVEENGALALGFFEPALQRGHRSGHSIVTSGLASFVPGSFGSVQTHASWWETDFPFMAWSTIADFGELQYLDVQTRRWGVGKPDAWVESDVADLPMTLARRDCTHGNSRYYVVRHLGKRSLAAEIDRWQAQALMLHLKKESGNPARVAFQPLDWSHRKAFLPISVLSPQISATIDALSWPVKGISDNTDRIFRMETVETVKRLLRRYDIEAVETNAKG